MKYRELFKAIETKPIISLKILKTKYHIDKKHFVLPLLFLFFFLINKHYFVFAMLTILSGLFSFYHDKFNRTNIDLKMPLFLGIMITWKYGLVYTLIFFVLSDIIPTLLAGGHIGGMTLPFYMWFFVVNALVLIFSSSDIILLGIILVIIEFIGSIIIKSFFGIPGFVAVFSSILSVTVRIIYFSIIGRLLLLLFNII